MVQRGVEHGFFLVTASGYPNFAQFAFPGLLRLLAYSVKVPVRNLGRQVLPRLCLASKRRTHPHPNRLTPVRPTDVRAHRLAVTIGLPLVILCSISLPYAVGIESFLKLNHKVAAETGLFAPALVDTVHRIVARDLIPLGVDFYRTLPLVAVRLNDQVHRFVVGRAKLQHTGVRHARYFRLNAVVVEPHRVVGGHSSFGVVGEVRSAFGGSGPQLSGGGHQRNATVVLGAGAAHPATRPESLDTIVLVVVGRQALLLGSFRLRRPLRHAEGHPHGRKSLPPQFGSRLTVSLRTGRGARCRADQRVDMVRRGRQEG